MTPLLRTAASTCGVMFSKPTRDGIVEGQIFCVRLHRPENTLRIRWLASAPSSCADGKRA